MQRSIMVQCLDSAPGSKLPRARRNAREELGADIGWCGTAARQRLSVLAKFDGQFVTHSSTYGGSGDEKLSARRQE
jgi:hypothetical protein